MPPILAFDIETIPDVEGLRNLHHFPADISDADVVELSQRLLRQEKKNDFFPPHLQRIVVISCLLHKPKDNAQSYQIFSLPVDDTNHNEAAAISMFFALIDKYTPTLISWNGGGFDLPVLHYRALKYGIKAATYWRNDDQFRWNNYTSRYHERHTDLMDVLGLYQARAWVSLDSFARLCNLPGKIGGAGGSVWEMWQQGKTTAIRHYCETDVLLTYLIHLRFQHFRNQGVLKYTEENNRVRQFLAQQGDRWQAFLSQWPSSDAFQTPPTASNHQHPPTLL